MSLCRLSQQVAVHELFGAVDVQRDMLAFFTPAGSPGLPRRFVTCSKKLVPSCFPLTATAAQNPKLSSSSLLAIQSSPLFPFISGLEPFAIKGWSPACITPFWVAPASYAPKGGTGAGAARSNPCLGSSFFLQAP